MSEQNVASLLSICMTKWLRKWRRGWHYVRSNTKKAKSLMYTPMIRHWRIFIHSNYISCSLIGSLVNTRSVENVHCTPRTAPRLRPDCAMCFWCVIARANVTSTDPFFSLGKVGNILHVYWHFKTILFIIFHEREQMILFFCRVWIRLINLHLLLLVK